MPALSDNLMAAGLNMIHSVHGQRVVIINGIDLGKTFIGTILVQPDDRTQGEVTEDRREKSVVVFSNDSWPANVKPEDRMRDESGQVWQFVVRSNNPADSSVDFEIIKIAPEDV